MALSRLYDEALVFASDLHRTQVRKGSGTPYIAHLLSVSSRVLSAGGNEVQAIAGLLRDAAEDQGGQAGGFTQSLSKPPPVVEPVVG